MAAATVAAAQWQTMGAFWQRSSVAGSSLAVQNPMESSLHFMTASSAECQQDFDPRNSSSTSTTTAVEPIDLMCLYLVIREASDNDEDQWHVLAIATRVAMKFDDKLVATNVRQFESNSQLLVVEVPLS